MYPIRKSIMSLSSRSLFVWGNTALFFVLGLSSCGGSPSLTLTPGIPSIPSIDAVDAAAVAEPYLDATKVHYYCDCQSGAQAGCVAGNDSNAGTSPSAPKQTIGNAANFLRSLATVNDTVALCKGGVFNVSSTSHLGSATCPAGTICNDLREYQPSWYSGSAKPVIRGTTGTATFDISGNYGGIRIMNIAMTGTYSGGSNSSAFFFSGGAHDVKIWNVDMDSFDLAIYDAGLAQDNNMTITGSHITNSDVIGYLGAANNTEISNNYWGGNGSNTELNHTIYFGGSSPVSNIKLVGNYIHGQYGPTCTGSPITAHLEVDGFTISGNSVIIDSAAATAGCWGMDLSNGGYGVPIYFRHTVISGNTFVNGGNLALSVVSCPGCIIENNLIVNDWSGAYDGIRVPAFPARTSPADDVNTNNIIRNNTVYYGPNATNGAAGISVNAEGTGHVIANNTVYYSSTSSVHGTNCFGFPLALGSYSFINNNNCYSASPYKWERTQQSSLAAWQTYAQTYGFDTASFTGDPQFTAVGTDFTPAAGSPLIGAGNAANGSATDITGKTRSIPPSIGAYN